MSYTTEILSREERRRLFHFDCPSYLEFRGWEPGGEFVKKIHIRNIDSKLQRVRYVIPKQKIFFMQYPETMRLASGTTTTFELVFRPVKLEYFEDTIEIVTERGSFFLGIRAYAPIMSFKLPYEMDFGFSTVNQVSDRIIEFENDGDFPIYYSWQVLAPFSISRIEGVVNSKSKELITLSFLPNEATVLVGQIVCTCKSVENGKINQSPLAEVSHTISISAISKYPHLTLSSDSLKFESIVGHNNVKYLELKNVSTVTSVFSFHHVENLLESPFSIQPMSGSLSPGESLAVKVSFLSLSADISLLDFYDLVTPGGNIIRLSLEGRATNMGLILSQSFVDFNFVHIGDSSEIALTLKNVSTVNDLEWSVPQLSSFSFTPSSGKIPASLSQRIVLKFHCHVPINYCHRFYFSVLNGPVVPLDVIATGFSDEQRPELLSFERVNVWRDHYGLPTADEDKDDMNMTDALDPPRRKEMHDEKHMLFSEGAVEHIDSDIRISKRSVQVYMDQSNGTSLLTLVNQSNKRFLVHLVLPNKKGFFSSDMVFDMEGNSEKTVRLGYKGKINPGMYLNGEVEFWVMPKVQRSFRLVSPDTIEPALCVHIPIIASATVDTVFSPSAALTHSDLILPGTEAGVPTFQTFSLRNESDTCLMFDFAPQGYISELFPFQFSPSIGVIPPRQSFIVSVRFYVDVLNELESYNELKISSAFKRSLVQYSPSIILNSKHAEMTSSPIHIRMNVLASATAVAFDPPRLIFPATCAGTESRRAVTARNFSAVPVRIEAGFLPPSLSLDRTPIIQPNGTSVFDVVFSASSTNDQLDESVLEKCELSLVPLHASKWWNGATTVEYEIETKTSEAQLRFEEGVIDFGSVLINAPTTQLITVHNDGECDVPFETRFLWNRAETDFGKRFGDWLKVTPNIGICPAHGLSTLEVTFYPQERMMYDISLIVIPASEHIEHSVDVSERHIVEAASDDISNYLCMTSLFVLGAFPLLAVTDVTTSDSNIPKIRLFDDLSIEKLNEHLSDILSPGEVEYRRCSGFGEVIDFDALPTVRMNFGKRPVNSFNLNVSFQFTNVGVLPIRAQFRDSTAFDVSVERWASTGPAFPKDVAFLKSGLFSLDIREFTLEPNERISIAVDYKRTTVGFHELPLIFEIESGKVIRLLLRFETLPVSSVYLDKLKDTYTLVTQPIGIQPPVVQFIPLNNPCTFDLYCTLKLLDYEEIIEDNHGFEVFVLPEMSFIIEAKSYYSLPISFVPIETKEYRLTAQIEYRVHGKKGVLQSGLQRLNDDTTLYLSEQFTIIGHGFDPRIDVITDKAKFNLPPAEVEHIGPVSLVPEAIYRPLLPINSVQREILTISNNSLDTYHFDVLPIVSSAQANVLPASGTLGPQSTALLLLTFITSSTPETQIFDIPITTYAGNETDSDLDDTANVPITSPMTAQPSLSVVLPPRLSVATRPTVSSLMKSIRTIDYNALTQNIESDQDIKDQFDTAAGVALSTTLHVTVGCFVVSNESYNVYQNENVEKKAIIWKNAKGSSLQSMFPFNMYYERDLVGIFDANSKSDNSFIRSHSIRLRNSLIDDVEPEVVVETEEEFVFTQVLSQLLDDVMGEIEKENGQEDVDRSLKLIFNNEDSQTESVENSESNEVSWSENFNEAFVFRDTQFQNMCEEILSNSLFNILRESLAEESEFTIAS
eukprot:TRINITY_DN3049_c0_g1_i1.p1 TRINITY_DN3049_c0_g1~~TRINITY_DN3049_c0_g1_i1.p1  ORF type:complete len:1683 (-),score=417.13 TRINITY_DN3049_c0_g1_i1:85-5133(-)